MRFPPKFLGGKITCRKGFPGNDAVMILSTLAHASRYACLHPGFRESLDYLASFDPATPAGRYEIAGTACFALVQQYETAPASTRRMEAHQKFIDIQYVLSGTEIIGVSTPEGQKPITDYNPEKDIQFFDGTNGVSPWAMRAGELAIFFPEDLHRPGCQLGDEPVSVTKVVVKIPV